MTQSEIHFGLGKSELLMQADGLVDTASLLYGLRIAAEESRQAAAEARESAAEAKAAIAEMTAVRGPAPTLAHLTGRFEGNPLWSEMEELAGETRPDADAE